MPGDADDAVEPNEGASKPEQHTESLSSQRVFKKCSPNNKLTLYLSSRDLVVSSGRIDRLQGVLLVDPDFVDQRKVYGQVTLTFRYGREDEEVMGLKFCNEAVMCLAQLYPPHPAAQPPEGNTPLQEALMKRLGPNAYAFSMEITPLAPPSVQLVPAKEYNGAPIGTSYDVRAYIAEKLDEKLHRRTTVRMGIRVVQRAAAPPAPYLYNPPGFQHDAKQNNKNGHKIPLYNCKSAPLQTCLDPNASPEKRKLSPERERRQSQKNGNKLSFKSELDIIRRDEEFSASLGRAGEIDDAREKDFPSSDQIELEKRLSEAGECNDEENKSDLEVRSSNRTPTHVSFKEELTNGGVDAVERHILRADRSLSDDENDAESPHTTKQAKLCENENNKKNHVDRIDPPCGGKRPSLAAFLAQVPPPHAIVDKPFLLSDGRVELEACLDKGIYSHGEEIQVTVQVRNFSSKTVKRIKVFIVQHVDVCMFSNGKFKNVVATVNSKEDCPIHGKSVLSKTYKLTPTKGTTKNWIALEDSYTKTGTSLASTVTSPSYNPQDRNVFAIFVTYYVKVKLVVSVMGGELSLKLPFTLMHTCSEFDPTWTREPETPPFVAPQPKEGDEVQSEREGT